MGRQKRISSTRVPDNNSRTKKIKALGLGELRSCTIMVDIKVDRFQFRTIANADIQQPRQTILACMEAAIIERERHI